jgi:hypothetical protein
MMNDEYELFFFGVGVNFRIVATIILEFFS